MPNREEMKQPEPPKKSWALKALPYLLASVGILFTVAAKIAGEFLKTIAVTLFGALVGLVTGLVLTLIAFPALPVNLVVLGALVAFAARVWKEAT